MPELKRHKRGGIYFEDFEVGAVIDGRVQFPLNTDITFTETGAHTDVTNVKWGDVICGVKEGKADVSKIDGEPTATSVELTGEANKSVVLGLENKTSSNGLIIIPIPIPLPPVAGWQYLFVAAVILVAVADRRRTPVGQGKEAGVTISAASAVILARVDRKSVV